MTLPRQFGQGAGTFRLSVRPLRLRLTSPLVTASGPIEERATWLVRIVWQPRPGGAEATREAHREVAVLPEGASEANDYVLHEPSLNDHLTNVVAQELVGYGEAAPLPGFGGGDPAEVPQSLAALGEALRELRIGLDAGSGLDPAAGPDALDGWRETAYSLAPTAPAARAAVEFALADLLAQIAGVPLSKWLIATPRDSVEVNGVIGAVPVEEAAGRAKALVAAGFGTIKLKVGIGLAADVARLAAVRAATGPQTRIRLDANGAWSADEALMTLEAFAKHQIELVEQPVPAEDIQGLARVRKFANIPVAADEALLTDGGPAAVLAAEAADVLVLKPSLLGGPLVALALAQRAASAGVSCFVTTALDGAVGRMGALHVAAALPSVDVVRSAAPLPLGDSARRGLAHGLGTGELMADDVAITPPVVAGRMAVPPTAGLGLGEIPGPWEPVETEVAALWV